VWSEITFKHTFLNRISTSSIGSLQPKYLQQSFITVILDVLNNIIRKRVTAKSNECSSALVSGQTSRPYKRTGMHFVLTRCRTTSSDAILPYISGYKNCVLTSFCPLFLYTCSFLVFFVCYKVWILLHFVRNKLHDINE